MPAALLTSRFSADAIAANGPAMARECSGLADPADNKAVKIDSAPLIVTPHTLAATRETDAAARVTPANPDFSRSSANRTIRSQCADDQIQ